MINLRKVTKTIVTLLQINENNNNENKKRNKIKARINNTW